MLNVPDHPASGTIDERDKLWFAVNPGRRQRVRAPFPSELRTARTLGLLKPLPAGQEYVVITQDLGSAFISQLVAISLDEPGVYPQSDEDIDRGFRRPKAPKGVPA